MSEHRPPGDPGVREESGASAPSKDTVPLPPKEGKKPTHLTVHLAEPLARPDRIGPYKILDIAGEGGMGVVYLAEQQEGVVRRVALKIIKLGMDTREIVARFESERQALALMNHPFIAQVYDAGATDTGRPYFVMEHVPGIPIHRYCDKQRLGTAGRLQLFLKVCDAVHHAHQKGIIHRDLKPSNILVASSDGRAVPKVIDFGVSRATNQRLTEQTVFTEMGRLIGTPEYMSPEQAEMSSLDVDTRTDIYSLGVILYELLTGRLPYDLEPIKEKGYDAIRQAIRDDDPALPSTRIAELKDDDALAAILKNRRTTRAALRKTIRGDLDWITMKALEKDRTRRYPTAYELAEDIERHIRHEPVLASPPSTPYRLKKFVWKYHRAVNAGLSVAFFFLAALAGVSWSYHRATVEHREEVGKLRRAMEEILIDRYELASGLHGAEHDTTVAALEALIDHFTAGGESVKAADWSRRLPASYVRPSDR